MRRSVEKGEEEEEEEGGRREKGPLRSQVYSREFCLAQGQNRGAVVVKAAVVLTGGYRRGC